MVSVTAFFAVFFFGLESALEGEDVLIFKKTRVGKLGKSGSVDYLEMGHGALERISAS